MNLIIFTKETAKIGEYKIKGKVCSNFSFY